MRSEAMSSLLYPKSIGTVERLTPPLPPEPPPVVRVTVNLTRTEANILRRHFGKLSENDMKGYLHTGEVYPNALALRVYDLLVKAASIANQ
jgi:hypothetical protein